MPQVRVHKQESRRADEDVNATSQAVGSDTVDVAGGWLDEIDEALEDWAKTDELARAFVADYQQKGGE